MDRFVSTFTNKIDAKGRVSVPASFRAVLERDGYAGEAASTATPRSTLRRSMQAARALRRKSTGFSTACRTIRTSGTSCLSRSMVTSTSSASIRTDASCFLKRFAPTPAFRPRSLLSAWAQKFQMWEPARFEERRARAREKVQDHRSCSARGAASIRGREAAREEHGNDGARGTRPAEGAPRGTVRHVPVLLPASAAARWRRQAGERYIDGTFGAGGYSRGHPCSGAGRACPRHRPRPCGNRRRPRRSSISTRAG